MNIAQQDVSTSDADADGEEDVDMIEEPELAPQPVEDRRDDAEEDSKDGGSEQDEEHEDPPEEDKDAEGEDEEEEDDIDVTTKYHGAVKIPDGTAIESGDETEASGDDNNGEDDEDEDDEDDAAAVGGESDSDSSDDSASDSDAENEWEKEQSVGVEGEAAEVAARNDCIFCGQDEEHDPSEDYEEYLACAVCGDNSHRQCARENSSFGDDTTESSSWRCPSCTENGLEVGGDADGDGDDITIQRRLSISSSRITRDLLPATRGTPKPGAHSIFNTLILEDDPGDGARALRKRKSDETLEDARSRASSKRPKTSDSKRESTLSPVASGRTARSTTTTSRTRKTPAAVPETKDEREEVPASLTSRPQRQRRPKKEVTALARVVRRSHNSLVMSMKVDMSRISFRPPKRKRAQGRPRTSNLRASMSGAPLHTMTPYTTPYYAFHDRENDDSKKPPYGGILTEDQADTSSTMPSADDRSKFETARQRAEEEWKRRSAAVEAEQEIKGRASQKVSGPPSKIKSIIFGKWEIDTWYAAPYPEEYSRNRVLYICEFCLKYMGSDFVAWRHKLKCPCKYPPGDEIYRDGSISVFEVDGRKNPAYCQNLCLLAKLFLGSKTLYYDVEPFLFYIMTEYDKNGYHFVGYFSKEKRPSSMNNVSCILTMPHHQRKGYGHLLIDFSYLLTRKEGRTGSPEKPLSDMGLVSYRNYWRLQLCYLLIDAKPGTDEMSVRSISDQLGMTPDDVISQLEALRVLVRDPVTKSYAFRLDRVYFKEAIEKWEAKGYKCLNPDRLVWTPYIMSRTSNLAIFDRPPIATVAPREDDEDDDDVAPEEGVQQQLQAEKQGSHMDISNGIATSDFATGDTSERPPDTPVQGVHELPLSSPAKPPILALTNGTGTADGGIPQSPVPAWRYELWPPVPGTIYRSRRGGYRPKGSRITPHGPIFGGSPATTLVNPTTPRGSRTSLRVSNKSVNGIGKSIANGDEAVDTEAGSVNATPNARRSTRSRMGTPGLEPLSGGLDGAGENVEEEEEGDDEEEEEDDDDDEDDDEEEEEGDEEVIVEGEDEEEEGKEHSGNEEDVPADGIEEQDDIDGEADDDYEDAEEDADGEEDEEDVAMDE